MTITSISAEATSKRETFFKLLFGPKATGYVCVAILFRNDDKKKMREDFFRWPVELPALLKFITDNASRGDTYYCPQLLKSKKRNKDSVGLCTAAWADLDDCEPNLMLVRPSLIVESSSGRYQALWTFEDAVDPLVAQDVSKRIAYYHASEGADKSGWDLTQLLRVPYTPNLKYGSSPLSAPLVQTVEANRSQYRVEDFDKYPKVKNDEYLDLPMPTEFPTAEPLDLIQKVRSMTNPMVFQLYDTEPESDWSKELWRLQMLLFEAGLEREEVFVIAKHAACNKYERDGRTDEHLWSDVCRAYARHVENVNVITMPADKLSPLMTEEEYKTAKAQRGFVERYVEWAQDLGDAAVQYHQAGAFVILSALLAGRVRLPTSFGVVVPNLWFMILADTTLTRKSTAMDIAMDLVVEVDPDSIMATDGSLEGLMTALSTRPGRASIFLRDEFSGLLEMMTKKDYYAGMAEMLTKLYDGKMQKRILRKETVEIRDPIFVIFAGGIRNRVQSLLTLDHVSSGFMPRFVYITAESNVEKIQPLGPPTGRDLGNRDELLEEMRNVVGHYHITQDTIIKQTGVKIPQPKRWEAKLSEAAWVRYNEFESAMLADGMASERPDLMTPVYDRLAKSTLKASVLLAASRNRESSVTVETTDILHAVLYCTKWREYAVEVINGVGKTAMERDLERVNNAIKKHPGITRGRLMQNYHLTAKHADAIFQTLEQRGSVTFIRNGRMVMYYTAGGR